MPSTSGIRSYQVVNEGTDEQFVSQWHSMNSLSRERDFSLQDFVWLLSINTTHRDYMDIYCINCGISSTSLLLEAKLVSTMLLQTSWSSCRTICTTESNGESRQRFIRIFSFISRIDINNGMSKLYWISIIIQIQVIQMILGRVKFFVFVWKFCSLQGISFPQIVHVMIVFPNVKLLLM